MGLWLEHRDEEGKLISSGRFVNRVVRFLGLFAEDEVYTIEQARQLCKFSTHLPLDKRDWTLRVSDDE